MTDLGRQNLEILWLTVCMYSFYLLPLYLSPVYNMDFNSCHLTFFLREGMLLSFLGKLRHLIWIQLQYHLNKTIKHDRETTGFILSTQVLLSTDLGFELSLCGYLSALRGLKAGRLTVTLPHGSEASYLHHTGQGAHCTTAANTI